MSHQDYVLLLSWLDFGTWYFTTTKMLLNFTGQMVRAPRGSFVAELLAELRRDCKRIKDAWLFGVLRMLSLGLSFRRSKCLVARVDSMLERIRDEYVFFNSDLLRKSDNKRPQRCTFVSSGATARYFSPEVRFISSPVWFLVNYRWAAHKQCINIALLCPLSARVGLVNELAYTASSKEIF